jgi:hypothetical protein
LWYILWYISEAICRPTQKVYMKPSKDPSELLSADEAQELLAPHLNDLAECIFEGWNRWNDLAASNASLSYPLTSRSRATYVNDHMWNAVKTKFASAQDVQVVETASGLRTLLISDRLTLRFKKLDGRLRPSNIPTRQQEIFESQLTLDGLPEVTRLTIGYILNRVQTEIDKIAIVLRVNKALIWSFMVNRSNETMTITQQTIDTAPTEQVRTRKVKVKKTRQNDEARTGND